MSLLHLLVWTPHLISLAFEFSGTNRFWNVDQGLCWLLILHFPLRSRTLRCADRGLLAPGGLRLVVFSCALVSLTGSPWLQVLHRRVTLHLCYRKRLSSTSIIGCYFERRRCFHGLLFLETCIVGPGARILSFLTRRFFQGDLFHSGCSDVYWWTCFNFWGFSCNWFRLYFYHEFKVSSIESNSTFWY